MKSVIREIIPGTGARRPSRLLNVLIVLAIAVIYTLAMAVIYTAVMRLVVSRQ